MENFFERLLAKTRADRKTDKEEMLARMDDNMKSYQEKTEANRKTCHNELLATRRLNERSGESAKKDC
jgi:hypothetical protein